MSLYTTYNTTEEAEAAAIAYAEENGSIPFDGMNCNDYKEDDEIECDGWDGASRRCDCGNRRVCWDFEKNPDGKFYAVARAY
jgi:hypothetical protein